MAALTLMLSLRARGSGPAIIARELALELGDGSFAPDLVEHLPGVVNVEAEGGSVGGETRQQRKRRQQRVLDSVPTTTEILVTVKTVHGSEQVLGSLVALTVHRDLKALPIEALEVLEEAHRVVGRVARGALRESQPTGCAAR